jgi:hypothetical protein
MSEMLQCLVNYFGLPTDDQGRPLRYYSYQIVGGPGPVAGSGVASITVLAAGDSHEIYRIYQNFHVAQKGGAGAAIEKAVHYLDAFHSEDRLRKVRTSASRQPSFSVSAN